ncbi:hypothetical protein BT67DRAFT_258644 [Trichocladium antarcticum]|uniref:Uncharacterized protein n=1 Tax=Trichocladium antarcticum TaxID=1450529 RepID=A0AAN6UME0_9PEZI|nr:hypothetical protein BT67DRAFT_258644 [Trichocladium antarcticum]
MHVEAGWRRQRPAGRFSTVETIALGIAQLGNVRFARKPGRRAENSRRPKDSQGSAEVNMGRCNYSTQKLGNFVGCPAAPICTASTVFTDSKGNIARTRFSPDPTQCASACRDPGYLTRHPPTLRPNLHLTQDTSAEWRYMRPSEDPHHCG